MGNVNARMAKGHEEEIRGPAGIKTMSLSNIGAQVVKVHVDGIVRTKEDIILDRVQPIFKVRHFEDLALKAQDVRNQLHHLGCFSEVSVYVDTAKDGGPKDYEVTFKVTELSRIKGSMNTMVGNQEGSLMTGLIFPNLIGRGERLKFDYSYGTKRTNTFNGSFSKPLRGDATATASIFQQMAEFPNSGYKEVNRGAVIDLTFMSAPQVAHNLSWEGVWRDLSCASRSTAFAVREHCGHTLKSSLKHILTVDRRDHAFFPTEGSLFRLNQEFAGLGGDVGFFKNEIEAQANFPLFGGDFVIQGTFHGGLLKRLENYEKTITIADKFFLGGPMNVRGFDMRGIGPHSDGNSLGGLFVWASGLHLYGPLPFRSGKGGFADLFRTHFFANAGNNIEEEVSNFEDVLKNVRLSFGLGLALNLGGIARVEVNYVIPYKVERGDKVAAGLQLGVGVNFL